MTGVSAPTADDWLARRRASYDTVAEAYADQLRDALAGAPFERGLLALFAGLVEAAGGGPVADLGCGPGRLTAHLHGLGLDAFGVDLSPGMVAVARRENPHLRFDVGTMTALDLPDGGLAGVLAWFSLVHVPDGDVPVVLRELRRVLRAGGVALLAFHAGEGVRHKTEGYGGHPMDVHVHRRTTAQVAALCGRAGLTVDAEVVHRPAPGVEGGMVVATVPA